MKRALTVTLAAAALTLAACSPSVPVSAPAAPAAATQSAPPSPAAPVYDNTTTCAAFHEATTTGVPAADAGEDTMTWLQSQTGDASPALQGQIGAFVAAWQDTPPDQAAIGQATRRIRRICAG
jgi:cytochrome c553